MVGYQKGTTPEGLMGKLRTEFALTCAAIQAWPDAKQAWDAAGILGDLTRELQGQAADFRGTVLTYLVDYHGWTHEQAASVLGISRPQVSALIKRAKQKGNPVTTDPMSVPEQLPVALAVITSDAGVLIAERVDGIPPWTFLGGEIQVGENAGDALRRRVEAEGGLQVTGTPRFIGRRIHPKTSRVMVYGHVEVASGEPTLGDREDLKQVKWVSIDDTRNLMPDMYAPVRQYLDQLQQAQAASQ